MDIKEYSGNSLSFIGDAVFTLAVRVSVSVWLCPQPSSASYLSSVTLFTG